MATRCDRRTGAARSCIFPFRPPMGPGRVPVHPANAGSAPASTRPSPHLGGGGGQEAHTPPVPNSVCCLTPPPVDANRGCPMWCREQPHPPLCPRHDLHAGAVCASHRVCMGLPHILRSRLLRLGSRGGGWSRCCRPPAGLAVGLPQHVFVRHSPTLPRPCYRRGGGVGMSPLCIVLVCSWHRLLADRHSPPFPWTLFLYRQAQQSVQCCPLKNKPQGAHWCTEHYWLYGKWSRSKQRLVSWGCFCGAAR